MTRVARRAPVTSALAAWLAIVGAGCAPASEAEPTSASGTATALAAAPQTASPAAEFGTLSPDSIAVSESGDLYVTECTNHRALRVDPSGVLTVFAGTGAAGYAGDGGPASDAMLDCPVGVALDAAGNVYIVEHFSNRVRRVDPAGVITTVVGGGPMGYNQGTFAGDGGAALDASLNEPAGIAVDEAGNLYIADRDNRRIRRVDTNGIITTIAGNGTIDVGGDGGPAIDAQLGQPVGVAIGPDGSVYIADPPSQRLRRVDSTGIITTVAGTGSPGYSGDGGPATLAQLRDPEPVVVDAEGSIYIPDRGNHRIRRIDTAGIITTIAGTGEPGMSPDGTPALDALLFHPAALAFGPNGDLYFVDLGSLSIRVLSTDGTISTVPGPNP